MLLRLFRSPLTIFALAAALAAVAGCDSGIDPNASADEGSTTVQFAEGAISALEEDNPTVEMTVELNNPGATASGEVSVEVLFAQEASSDEFSLDDLGIFDLDESRAFRDSETGDLSGYVLETVTFPEDAEDGATRTVEFDIVDEVEEGQEEGIFILQNARSSGSGSVGYGGIRELALTIEAEGTVTLLSEDFANDAGEGELGVFTAYSVASGQNWGPSSAGNPPNAPYAVVNGFQNGAGEPSNDWLISPALDFSSVASETLTFLNAKNFDDGGLERGLLVKVSTDYDGEGNPEDFTWTDVSDRVDNYSGGGYEFVESGEVDLSDDEFQDASVYVAFQYLSSGTGAGTSEAWEVDEITLVALGEE